MKEREYESDGERLRAREREHESKIERERARVRQRQTGTETKKTSKMSSFHQNVHQDMPLLAEAVRQAFEQGLVQGALARQGLDVRVRLMGAPRPTVGRAIQVTASAKLCGNGYVNTPAEECDDGNSMAGDGCSSDCKVEDGFFCSASSSAGSIARMSTCHTSCGDLIVAGREECEDGNYDNDDGCSSYCRVEEHWRCIKRSNVQTPQGRPFGSWNCLPLPSCGVNGLSVELCCCISVLLSSAKRCLIV